MTDDGRHPYPQLSGEDEEAHEAKSRMEQQEDNSEHIEMDTDMYDLLNTEVPVQFEETKQEHDSTADARNVPTFQVEESRTNDRTILREASFIKNGAIAECLRLSVEAHQTKEGFVSIWKPAGRTMHVSDVGDTQQSKALPKQPWTAKPLPIPSWAQPTTSE